MVHVQIPEQTAFLEFVEALFAFILGQTNPSPPPFLLSVHDFLSSLLSSSIPVETRCAAIRLFSRLPAVVLQFPSCAIPVDSLVESMFSMCYTAGMISSTASSATAAMLFQLVSQSGEKARSHDLNDGATNQPTTSLSVETALRWIMKRLETSWCLAGNAI